MLKNVTKLELSIDGKIFQLFCDSESQIVQVKEFAYQILKYVGAIEDGIRQKQEEEMKSKEDEKKPEVVDGDKQ